MRPADVLTRALNPTIVVATDVGVRAPHAPDAGEDPLGQMRMDKLHKHAAHRDDLVAQGIVYEPTIFSAHGRRHPKATDMIKFAASWAARRRGWSTATGLMKWWSRQLAAELWRKLARMNHVCVPRGGHHEGFEQTPPDDDADSAEVSGPGEAHLGERLVR